MDNNIKTMHFNQIPVAKDNYLELLKNNGSSIAEELIKCIDKRTTTEYKKHLLIVSSRLYELGRLVYISGNSVSKETSEKYEHVIFDNYSSYQDEYETRVGTFNYNGSHNHFDSRSNELLKKTISFMLSNTKELIYMSEYAGLIDFIINRANDLRDPKFENSMFVTNWDGYDPVENDITREFMDEFGLY